MGNLVFQATLGGQVNLVGPNTASTYNINVPTVNSTLATLAAQTFAGTQTISSGNLVFSGTSQVVSGDFSNATVASRTAFQTSTSNSSTGIYALPNGTSTAASWQATNAADPTNASKILIATNGSTDVQLVSGRNGTGTYLPLTFYTNGSEQMRLDTSGNLGLGVTPSAWTSTFKAMQVGARAAFYSDSSANSIFSNNIASVSNTNTYLASAAATLYLQGSGQHQWYNAASGTAGNAITFTQAMTLDASGNLLLGTTSISNNGLVIEKSNAEIRLQNAGGTNRSQFYSNSSGLTFGTIDSNPIVVRTNATEVARFDSSGGFIVNGSTTLNTTRTTFYSSGNVSAFSTTLSAADICTFYTSTNTYAGKVASSSNTTSYVSASDYRLKEDIQPMTGALARVAALKPVNYKWKSNGEQAEGFIAHELAEVCPQAVDGEKDAVDEDGNPVYQGIDTSFLVATLTAALQEQQAIINTLTTRIEALEAK